MNQRSKAQALVEALREANQRIITTEKDSREVRGKITDLYRMMVTVRNELAKSPTSSETIAYPRIATEDLAEMRPVQLINVTGDVISVIAKNLISIRTDYRELAAGLEDADSALEEWQSVRIGGDNLGVAHGFRKPAEGSIGAVRPETPEPPLARPAVNLPIQYASPMPPSPANSAITGQESSSKPKAPAVTSPTKTTSAKTPSYATGKGKK